MIEEDAADPARLAAMLEIKVLVAPLPEMLGVSHSRMALAGGAHRRVKGDRVRIVRLAALIEHRRQIRSPAKPDLGRAHESCVHVHGRHVRAPRMGDHGDAGGPEARVFLGAGNLRRKLGRQDAVNDRQVRAHLLEQAAAQQRHPAAAAGSPAGVGSLPGLDREPAGRDLGPGIRELALQRLHRLDDPALEGLEPLARADEARFVRRRPRNGHGDFSPRTRATRRSTWPTGVSGGTPWPRLKIWARGENPSRTRSTSLSRRAPPAARASGSRLPWSAKRSGSAAIAAFGATAVSRPIASMSARAANFASCVPAPRGKAMIGACGAPALTLAASAAIGATHQRSNSAGGSTPAQESKICTASAPAAS